MTDTLFSSIVCPPTGTLLNGKIVVTVASNNLTVAIKQLNGDDPSASLPVSVRIGNSFRQITAALSVTIAAGTNTFGAGGADLATLEQDYFPYLIWNTNLAPDAVDIMVSPIPYGALYSDFSGTATVRTYAAINATAPAATDECCVVGRFAATLSAGAGYTWTVPTFTNKNLVQRPVYETDWHDWVPTASASGSLTWTTLVVTRARYRLVGRRLDWMLTVSATLGGSASNVLYLTLPFDVANVNVCGFGNTSGVASKGIYIKGATLNTLSIEKYDASNYATSGAGAVTANGFCEM